MDIALLLKEQFGTRLRIDEPMRLHTNFRIGGPARYYVDARTTEEVVAAITTAARVGIPWVVLGGGSNALVADTGFPGLVLQMANRQIAIDGTTVTAGAGAITAAVAREAGAAGLAGYAWAVSLPGTIGGAVRGNAGCFGGETKDVVREVRVLRCSAGGEWGVGTLSGEVCGFRYRHSLFKEHHDWVILEVVLALRVGDVATCRQQMEEYLARRKTKQPLERPSAGCLFTNVVVERLTEDQRSRLDAVAAGAWSTVVHDGQLPAGWLIERSGAMGLRVGNAMISEKHGNFVVNLGGATADEVAALSAMVQERVRDTFGIALHEEVQRIGFSEYR
ncbi:UDP-N-acetylmuramate dehydrogenase [Candidatus Uhrbacteria bacterium]|nr:UDP-N-acetylmuramate dehydrogenase [Candidatus Uhrbacteria bacterium]